jgi:hypothetical protein
MVMHCLAPGEHSEMHGEGISPSCEHPDVLRLRDNVTRENIILWNHRMLAVYHRLKWSYAVHDCNFKICLLVYAYIYTHMYSL